MVNCHSCKQEFPAVNIWAEVFQAKELETRRKVVTSDVTKAAMLMRYGHAEDAQIIS